MPTHLHRRDFRHACDSKRICIQDAALFDHDPELRLSGQPRTPSPSEQDMPPKIAAKNGAKTAAKTAAKTVDKAGGASATKSVAKTPGNTATPAHAAPAEDSFYISATESAS